MLLSGNHAKIAEWRRKEALKRTLENRPDLLKKAVLSAEDKKMLQELCSQKEIICRRRTMNLIKAVEERFRKEVAQFNVGDTVRTYVKVVEGDKERLQPFEVSLSPERDRESTRPSW